MSDELITLLRGRPQSSWASDRALMVRAAQVIEALVARCERAEADAARLAAVSQDHRHHACYVSDALRLHDEAVAAR